MEKKQNDIKVPIFVLLTRTTTIVSRGIHCLTNDTYTHASLSLDPSCKKLYSFARKYEKLPLPGGLINESIYSGLLGKNVKAPCLLYRVWVSSEVYENIKADLEEMMERQDEFSYSVIGTAMCFFNREFEREKKFFCSQFVAHMLSKHGIIELTKPESLYHPIDFTKHSEFELVYSGTVGELANNQCDAVQAFEV